MKLRIHLMIPIGLFLLAFALCADDAVDPPNAKTNQTALGDGIVQRLERIVEIHEERAERRARSGVAWESKVALIEARIRLADEKQDNKAVIAELEKLVSLHKKRLEWQKQHLAVAREQGDRAGRKIEPTAELPLLEAEIRLLRAQPK